MIAEIKWEEFTGDYKRILKNGENLTPEKKEIAEKQDWWMIALIDSLGDPRLEGIGNSFRNLSLKHYLEVQVGTWFKREKELLQLRLGRPPTNLELIDDAEKNRNMQRYKLCYALKHPKKVIFDKPHYFKQREETDLFLADAELLHPYRYPYFEIIWHNTEMLLR